MAFATTELEGWRAQFEQQLRDHKGKYISQATMFITLGILAAALPAATALSVELIIGIVLLMAGIFQLILTLRSKMHWWSILSSFLSMAVGVLMLSKPLAGLLAVVTILALFMTAEGIFELLLAFEFRPMKNWSWMLFSGIVTLLLALVLWLSFPTFAVLYLGWIVAINFILYGLSLMMLVWRVAS